MRKKDFLFFMWTFPLLGAFAGLAISTLLQVGNASAGIVIILGIMSGFMALLTLILGHKLCNNEGDDNGKV